MRKLFLLLLLCGACQQKKTLSQQLTITFTNHLQTLDPTVSLDSIHILWNIPVTQKLSRVIDDTVYVREYSRIKSQLASAQAKQDKDSIEFYNYEIAVLERGIDSVSKAIEQGDTTHRYGSLIACQYFLRKNNRSFADSTLLFIDSTHTIRYTEYMDSSIARTITANK
jgi:hypothetical protein